MTPNRWDRPRGPGTNPASDRDQGRRPSRVARTFRSRADWPCAWLRRCADAARQRGQALAAELVEGDEAPAQHERQCFDRATDLGTIACRPLGVAGLKPQTPNQLRAGIEAIGVEVGGDKLHAALGNGSGWTRGRRMSIW